MDDIKKLFQEQPTCSETRNMLKTLQKQFQSQINNEKERNPPSFHDLYVPQQAVASLERIIRKLTLI